MQPTPELIDRLYQEEIERAREMDPAEKVVAGLRLFDMSCRIMLDGIRHQFPNLSDGEHQEILGQRLELARKLERGDSRP